MTFPSDTYTPYGYLRNPAARATAWTASSGGLLRSTDERPGFGWFYPHGRRPTHGCAVELVVEIDGRRYVTRADFAELGLYSEYHSSNLFSYEWNADKLTGSFYFFLAEPDALVCVAGVTNEGWDVRNVALELLGHVWGPGDPVPITVATVGVRPVEVAHQKARQASGGARKPDPAGRFELHPAIAFTFPGSGPRPIHVLQGENGRPIQPDPTRAGFRFELRLSAGQAESLAVELGRDEATQVLPLPAANLVISAWRSRVYEDADFWRAAPSLEGDWPDHWRRGWVYDLETTRMLLFPPGGVFDDVWPAWMAHFPRAVLAEGTLDLARLAYADPATARRALLSLFRDTGPNVPCVFQGGEPNMVAADGSVCGTSPAWCIPYHNVLQVYLREPDRAWLAELYPYLVRYLEWWREHRTDADGWLVYKCTWEAGEDNSPRLDPQREGDHVVEQYVRPVELQAAAAYSYHLLAIFAAELDRKDETRHWLGRAREYREKTRLLWDESEGRFRDWDKRRNDFIRPVGDTEYWGTDPGRYSPLALISLLGDVATPEQRARLRAEIEHYDAPPWCDWPSWAYVVLEGASAAGWHDFAARMAYKLLDRVWAENDRDPTRTLIPTHFQGERETVTHPNSPPGGEGSSGPPPAAEPSPSGTTEPSPSGRGQGEGAPESSLAKALRPLPGVAREYWPTDLSTWNGHDCYGWGATTANIFLRQIVGFREDLDTHRAVFRLCPALPDDLLNRGRRFGVRTLSYRGRRFDLWYESRVPDPEPRGTEPDSRIDSAENRLAVTLEFSAPVRLRASGPGLTYEPDAKQQVHRLTFRNYGEYRLRLD